LLPWRLQKNTLMLTKIVKMQVKCIYSFSLSAFERDKKGATCDVRVDHLTTVHRGGRTWNTG
jgi:hypothetical protein